MQDGRNSAPSLHSVTCAVLIVVMLHLHTSFLHTSLTCTSDGTKAKADASDAQTPIAIEVKIEHVIESFGF